MTQLGYLDVPDNHSTICNDVWGYTDELGNEYALVGTEDGVSIVHVTDPLNPIEVEWIDGMYSVWRDIKVYDDYAYVTTEADEGLMIIDLSPLPGSSTLPFSHYSGPVGNEWLSAHNLYEDNGYLYIFGAGRGNGGLIILDVFTDPLNPIEVGIFDTWYAHDGYVRDDTIYLAHINDGFFSILDIVDKANPVLLGSANTPSNFAHNIWASDDGNIVYTTDEVSAGYIASFDVSNPANIIQLDKIQSSPGQGIVPHNVHVLGDYLVTAYYADGVVIHDATYPNNMVEVANFDTSPLNAQTTVGCWGAYPFLGSGNILAADREEGLFVLSADMHQGAYLEGLVTEFGSGTQLSNVKVTIEGQNIDDFSNVLGDYATGTEATGTYDVTYFKVLYYPQTVSVNLTEGLIANQDIELNQIPQYSVTITVLDALTLDPIENADVIMNHTYISHPGVTDINGEVVLDIFYESNYEIIAGKWGHISSCFEDTLINSSVSNVTLYLDEGIYDDFTFDNGWTIGGDATNGMWEREVPVGVDNDGTIENPFEDAAWDCGNIAFLTGNGTQSANTQEVEGGETVIISPVFDLTGYTDPHINFSTFFYNMFGPFYPDDTLLVTLFNGTTSVPVAKIYKDNTPMSLWMTHSIPVGGLITPTANMQLIVSISDYSVTGNICEAAFDHFMVTDFSMASLDDIESKIEVYPNPTDGIVYIRGVEEGTVQLLDVSGRLLKEIPVSETIDISEVENGLYMLVIMDIKGNIVEVSKHMKQ